MSRRSSRSPFLLLLYIGTFIGAIGLGMITIIHLHSVLSLAHISKIDNQSFMMHDKDVKGQATSIYADLEKLEINSMPYARIKDTSGKVSFTLPIPKNCDGCVRKGEHTTSVDFTKDEHDGWRFFLTTIDKKNWHSGINQDYWGVLNQDHIDLIWTLAIGQSMKITDKLHPSGGQFEYTRLSNVNVSGNVAKLFSTTYSTAVMPRTLVTIYEKNGTLYLYEFEYQNETAESVYQEILKTVTSSVQ